MLVVLVELPGIITFLVIMLEFFGALAIMAGLFTRAIALSYIVLVTGIVFTTHIQNGFFMNWFGNQKGEGYEYFILWIAISVALVFAGGGKYALDQYFTVNKSNED